MNPEDLKVLAERASTVEGRGDARLDEVHARIQRAGRRRQLVAVTASAIAVVLALTAGTAILALTNTDRTPPANPPRPTASPSVAEAPSVRRLTYATGDKIHWGDRVIDVGGVVGNVAATDAGVVFTRGGPGEESGNCNKVPGCFGALWFTDGSDIVRIGRAYGTGIRGYRVNFSSAGSTVVWLEPALDDRPGGSGFPGRGEYVAYDTGARREVGRFGSARSHIVAVLDDSVYWLPDETWCGDDAFYEQCPRLQNVMRFDISSGTQQRVPWASYVADRRSRPRTLVTPNTEHALRPGPELTGGVNFLREGNRLVPDDGNGGTLVARLTLTGAPVRLTVPDRYTDLDWFPMLMWLDDDRLALTADDGDILVCRLSSGRCRTAVTGSPLTGFGGRG